MKRFLILALAAAMSLSCTQETNLSILPDIAAITFDPSGGEFDVVVFTNGYWKATCEDEAVTFAPDTGNFTTPMHVVVGPNTEQFTKSIRISLTTKLDGNSRSSKIAITQACNPFIFSEEAELPMPAAGGMARFHVNASLPWQVVSTLLDGSPVDLEVDPLESGPNSVTVSVRIPENPSGNPRTYTVTLALKEDPEVRVVLTVSQAA